MMTWREAATEAIEVEAIVVSTLAERLDAGFEFTVDAMAACTGRVVVVGLGKSGLVGAKIAASLASTGTPSFFVHAADGLHGDAGAIHSDDVVLAISSSGRTAEVVRLAELAKLRGCTIVAMVGLAKSPLGLLADAIVDIGVHREADPLGLVPTSSTTATLVLGDALVAALMTIRGFTRADFGVNHPGGALGAAVRASG